MKTTLTTLFAVAITAVAFAQSPDKAVAKVIYYKMPNGKIIDFKTYEKVKENLSKNGKVEEIIISKINRNDTIIITPKLNVLTQKDKNGNFVDSYAEQKKLIGLHFPIELFKNEKGQNYAKDLLKGKPTLINFWFTNCIPCIAEIPILNSLKESLETKVNFFAITFENNKNINSFLRKQNLKYNHILNAKEQIKQLKIVNYPINLILDKEGTVIDVYGEISSSEEQILKTLNALTL